MLSIQSLSVEVNGVPVVHNLMLDMQPGTIHCIMGPNGSGKSSLAFSLMGHPAYKIVQGAIMYESVDITALSPDKRAQKGFFLSVQYPPAIPGVTVYTLLKESYTAITGNHISAPAFARMLYDYMDIVNLDYACAYRPLSDGFSGGERKRLELLQALILKPRIAIFDEIDSGLDVEGLKMLIAVIERLRRDTPLLTVLMITHYPHISVQLPEPFIHILKAGHIVHSGGIEVAHTITTAGYHGYA